MITRIRTTLRRGPVALATGLTALALTMSGCSGDDGAGVREEGATSESASGTGSEGGSASK